MPLQSKVFLLVLTDYTTINIITLKINGMKDLPNLTQRQENLSCIYRFQMGRSRTHSTKHMDSFFSPPSSPFPSRAKLSERRRWSQYGTKLYNQNGFFNRII